MREEMQQIIMMRAMVEWKNGEKKKNSRKIFINWKLNYIIIVCNFSFSHCKLYEWEVALQGTLETSLEYFLAHR